uniref:VrlC protein n=1 Tax=uncultured Bacteroidota bacterium TaxID=152509 RepID=A0A1B0Z1Q7_9BACT|nr:VrlC protein [uncultured Bacteroidetes bacterium]
MPTLSSPLAQTFTVEGDPEFEVTGRYLTSVDVYFAAKDDNLPITLEIRTVLNGYPGNKVLPFSRVIKNSADINVSDTAATATTFTFPSLVFVEIETEYAVVLKCSTPEYNVWVTRIGDIDIGGTRTISEQPHIGLLYKSQASTTLFPSPQEDLKFAVKCAKFDIDAAGLVTLTNDDVPDVTLANNSLVMDETTTLKIRHPDHHMYATSNNVTIAGVESGASTTLNGSMTAAATTLTLTSGTNFDDTSGKYSKTASNLWHIKIDDEIMTYSTISTNAVSGLSRGVNSTTAAAHADGATVELYQAHKVPFTEINKTHTAIANIEIDSYTVTLTTTPVTDGASGTTEFGGRNITASENALMDYMQTIIGALELQNVAISSKAITTSGTSPGGTQTSFVSGRNNKTVVPDVVFPLNDNYRFEFPHLIASSINETNELSSLRSYQTELKLTSQTSSLSPVLDLERSSLIAVSNRLNNVDSSSDVYPTTEYVSSELAEGDQNAAIYLTKQITLENLATSLKVLLAAHRPSTNDIKLMYKVLGADESVDFQDLGFRYFNTDGGPDETVQPSADINDYQDYVYTAGVTDDGIGTPLQEFISFQIKIIMQGTNTSEPPRLKDLRVLALAT